MKYQPIENYGIVGDLNTIALAGLNGSVDFLCMPNFDSPSVFAALLDEEKGGSFSITPVFKQMKTKQLYLPKTNVLLTRFLSKEGMGEITDFMPVEEGHGARGLVRRVMAVRGKVHFEMECRPRFNYARTAHTIKIESPTSILFTNSVDSSLQMKLTSTVPMDIKEQDAVAMFTLEGKQTADFFLEFISNETPAVPDLEKFVSGSLLITLNFWKDWVARSTYTGRWRDMVNRSSLVLKLLTFHKCGSIVASPTFGLPESIGFARNWDYRYTWIRDSSFTLYALSRLGYTKEAGAFMTWLRKYCNDIKEQNRLGIMYSIEGEKVMNEVVLDHLEGYKKSSPVRIGNNAYSQLQLDIYGELIDAVYLFNKYGEPISYDFWMDLQSQMDWLGKNWNQPDEGIWEVRGGRQKFLYSRLMCWVAFDRAIKIAEARSFPFNEGWKEQRDIIFKSVYADFWNEDKQAFMQFPGSSTVDASTLLMPMIRFISPKDPKWLSTLKRIEDELVIDSLVYRYRPEDAAPDGLVSHEGTFSMCS
ncbi:MAG: glycoside hydrolase family 15 protein, partial [Flavitalea sp.]